MNKWKAARKVAQDNGWEFQIWTENTLDSLGIRPKVKALKPLPKMKKPKKKI